MPGLLSIRPLEPSVNADVVSLLDTLSLSVSSSDPAAGDFREPFSLWPSAVFSSSFSPWPSVSAGCVLSVVVAAVCEVLSAWADVSGLDVAGAGEVEVVGLGVLVVVLSSVASSSLGVSVGSSLEVSVDVCASDDVSGASDEVSGDSVVDSTSSTEPWIANDVAQPAASQVWPCGAAAVFSDCSPTTSSLTVT